MRKILLSLFMLISVAASAQDFSFNEMTYSPEATTFRLFAPATAKRVVVRIDKNGIGGKALQSVKMQYAGGLWTATVKGDLM